MTYKKNIKLADGAGTVEIELDANFFTLSKRDREFLGNLIYLIQDYENEGDKLASPNLSECV